MSAGVRTAWLITATSPEEIFGTYAAIDRSKDLVIAVDAGLQRVHALGLVPDLIIGDMDSVDEELLNQYSACPQLRHPVAKNETDTELALLWCLEAGVGEIVICNGLEGRFDHSLALLQNLEMLHGKGVPARIASARQKLWFLDPETLLNGCRGCQLSLLAWGSAAELAGSTGLRYPLAGLTLHPRITRGVSNLVESDAAIIKLASGLILAILTEHA